MYVSISPLLIYYICSLRSLAQTPSLSAERQNHCPSHFCVIVIISYNQFYRELPVFECLDLAIDPRISFMRGNCAPVAISDIHRDVLINFLSTFKFLMSVALSFTFTNPHVWLHSSINYSAKKIHRNYLFMTFLFDRRSYILQIRGKKDTTITVIFIERQNNSLGQRTNAKLIFRL